jgi:hypothetical protein
VHRLDHRGRGSGSARRSSGRRRCRAGRAASPSRRRRAGDRGRGGRGVRMAWGAQCKRSHAHHQAADPTCGRGIPAAKVSISILRAFDAGGRACARVHPRSIID